MNVTSATFGTCVRDAVAQAGSGGLATTLTPGALCAGRYGEMAECVFMAPLAFVPSSILSHVSRIVKWGMIVGGVMAGGAALAAGVGVAALAAGVGVAALAEVVMSRVLLLPQSSFPNRLPAHMIWEARSRVCFNSFKFRRNT